MSDVWRLDLPTVEKMVFLIIADHANDEGTQSYPSQATISVKASLSVRTVQRAINSLTERGYIRVFKHSGGSASTRDDRRPHLYQINVALLRGDRVTGRTPVADGATLTTSTGRQSRPKNNHLEPSNETPEFLQFWEIYPLHMARAKAWKAWRAAVKDTSVEVILDGARRYRDDPHRDPAFTAYPASWLNAHRWLDEPLPGDREAMERAESLKQRAKEREETQAFLDELARHREKSVPMPSSVRDALKKNIGQTLD